MENPFFSTGIPGGSDAKKPPPDGMTLEKKLSFKEIAMQNKQKALPRPTIDLLEKKTGND